VATAIESGKEDLKVSYKDVPERHRSIRAVFEHSWRLLTEEERSAFVGLAVFRGGFTAEAAQQVAGASLEELDALVEHSLVRYDPKKERYDLHELVRQYGMEKLIIKGIETEFRQRHCSHFIEALKCWAGEQKGIGLAATLREMDEQLSDVRAAWEWACQHQDLVGLSKGWEGLSRYYHYRANWLEGEHDCRAALITLKTIVENSPQKQRFKGLLLLYQGLFQRGAGRIDNTKYQQILENSLQIMEGLQQSGEEVRSEIAIILKDLGFIIGGTNPGKALQLTHNSLELARQIGNKRCQALSLSNLASIYFDSGKFEEAECYCLDALTIWRTLCDPQRTATELQCMSEITAHLGKLEIALQATREGAELLYKLGDRVSKADGLRYMALGFYHSSQWDEADRYYADSLLYMQDIVDRQRLCNIYANWSMVKMFSGHYEAAQVIADSNNELANQIQDTYSMMINHYTLGGVALPQGQLEQAAYYLEKAVDSCNQNGFHFISAQVMGTWSIALSRMEQIREGHERMIEALQSGVELHSYTNLSFAVPAAALLLAINGQAERAVELCGLIDEKAMCGKTPWFEDVAGKTIKELAADLSPEVVEAARERGRQRDLFITAAELLKEFKEQECGSLLHTK
jgi:tetratricopeptide (TPR) repeat protein